MGGKHLGGAATDEVWTFDPLNSGWNQEAAFPFGSLWRASACSYNGKGYLLFGRDEHNQFQHGFYAFDPTSNQWDSLPAFPSLGRSHAALFALNDGVYASFGIDSLGNSHNDLWKFDELSNAWIALPGVPSVGRRGGVCLTSQDAMDYVTGIDEANQRLTEHWRYSPSLGYDFPEPMDKKLLGRFDVYGNQVHQAYHQLVFERFSDGSVRKVFMVLE
jgi:N-acetylneuraminic acid mutarotase